MRRMSHMGGVCNLFDNLKWLIMSKSELIVLIWQHELFSVDRAF